QGDATVPAFSLHSVSQDVKQRFQVIAATDMDASIGSGQGAELLGLVIVATKQDQELRRPVIVVSMEDDAAGQKRQNLRRRNALSAAGHAQEGAQRPRNVHFIFDLGRSLALSRVARR